jgi:hypothetical protein
MFYDLNVKYKIFCTLRSIIASLYIYIYIEREREREKELDYSVMDCFFIIQIVQNNFHIKM